MRNLGCLGAAMVAVGASVLCAVAAAAGVLIALGVLR